MGLVFELVTYNYGGVAFRASYREDEKEVVFERADTGAIEMVVSANSLEDAKRIALEGIEDSWPGSQIQ